MKTPALLVFTVFTTFLIMPSAAKAWHPTTGFLLRHYADHYIQEHSHHGEEHARSTPAPDRQALPNPSLTPGALNPQVTQSNIDSTICRRGYTRTIRPPEHYTENLKRKGIRTYGYTDRRLSHYEEDHLVSLELGGSPTSPLNLWPEPHYTTGGWGSYTKDKLENRLRRMVCQHQITLKSAQYQEAHDWIAAYKRYIGNPPRR